MNFPDSSDSEHPDSKLAPFSSHSSHLLFSSCRHGGRSVLWSPPFRNRHVLCGPPAFRKLPLPVRPTSFHNPAHGPPCRFRSRSRLCTECVSQRPAPLVIPSNHSHEQNARPWLA